MRPHVTITGHIDGYAVRCGNKLLGVFPTLAEAEAGRRAILSRIAELELVDVLDAYLSAERASAICGDRIRGQWVKADELHDELLRLALACGYEPSRTHRHLSTVEFAQHRAAVLVLEGEQ